MARAGVPAKVPVAEVALYAYRAVFGRLSLFFDLAWLPLLLTLLATILPGYLRYYAGIARLPSWPGDAVGLGIDTLIEAIIGLLCLNAFAVRWHQSLLLPRGGGQSGAFLGPWLRFLAYTLLLYLLAASFVTGILFLGAADASPLVAALASVAVIALWLIPVRCALVFPAAACGRPLSLLAAWRALRGNAWRLLASGVLVCLPAVFIAALILSGVFAGFHLERFRGDVLPPGFFVLRGIIETCANFVVMGLGASVLAFFYRRTVVDGPIQLGGATAPGNE